MNVTQITITIWSLCCPTEIKIQIKIDNHYKYLSFTTKHKKKRNKKFKYFILEIKPQSSLKKKNLIDIISNVNHVHCIIYCFHRYYLTHNPKQFYDRNRLKLTTNVFTILKWTASYNHYLHFNSVDLMAKIKSKIFCCSNCVKLRAYWYAKNYKKCCSLINSNGNFIKCTPTTIRKLYEF